jgi:hypothetical protein
MKAIWKAWKPGLILISVGSIVYIITEVFETQNISFLDCVTYAAVFYLFLKFYDK